METKVAYIYDENLNNELDKVDPIRQRSRMVHELVFSYELHSRMTVVSNEIATEPELVSFHSQHYIDFLKKVNNATDTEKFEDTGQEFGLGYDCPLINGLYDFVRAVAGSSITAANILTNGKAHIAVNWYGGWHHAQRDEAAGFCYVNDIVCAIHKLLEKFKRVLYIDLDAHHGNHRGRMLVYKCLTPPYIERFIRPLYINLKGDGVENAFYFTKRVMTVSFHKFEVGFYPGTGALSNIGKGDGRFYSVNVPLKDGINDVAYLKIFNRVISAVEQAFSPDVIVMQCGADCLTGDPLGSFNITPKGLGQCVQKILSYGTPTLFVGGGGYNLANTARCWVYLTSLIVGCEIPSEIPDNKYFNDYGPDFDVEVIPSNRRDYNTTEDIENIVTNITENLRHIE